MHDIIAGNGQERTSDDEGLSGYETARKGAEQEGELGTANGTID